MNFSYSSNIKNIGFSNIHSETIQWNISSPESFFEFSPKSGSLPANEVEEIQVYLKREQITSDSIETTIVIESSLGDQLSMKVSIQNFPEQKLRLDFNVSAAEFNTVKNELYMLNSQYNKESFVVYDVESARINKYDFGQNFNNISVSPNGSMAALFGYYDDIKLINLNTMTQIEELQLGEEVSDVIFVNENFFCIVVNDSYQDFYTFNVSENELLSYDLDIYSYDYQKGKLHPEGNYIYLLNDDYYSNNISKVNVTQFIPVLEYKEYVNSFKYPFWFNKSGDQIIFSSKVVADLDANASGYDISNIQNIEEQANSISTFCQNDDNENYYIHFNYSSSFKSNVLSIYSKEMEFLTDLETEDFVYVSNPTSGYQYSKADINFLFYSPVSDVVIIITDPNSNQVQYDAIEVISGI
jgi:hypothetical protein